MQGVIPRKENNMAKSKKYTEAVALLEADKKYTLDEAVALVKKTTVTKFDSSIELHVRLGINTKQGDQQVRATITLPHTVGKSKIIAAFVDPDHEKEAKEAGADLIGGEELIAKIKTSGKIEFDEAVALPQMMPKLAQIAKILGPKGLMPSPKSETVGPDITKMVTELKQGKITYKNDDTANVHMTVAKVSFDEAKIKENLEAALDSIKKNRPTATKGTYIKKVTIATTMGPGLEVIYE